LILAQNELLIWNCSKLALLHNLTFKTDIKTDIQTNIRKFSLSQPLRSPLALQINLLKLRLNEFSILVSMSIFLLGFHVNISVRFLCLYILYVNFPYQYFYVRFLCQYLYVDNTIILHYGREIKQPSSRLETHANSLARNTSATFTNQSTNSRANAIKSL
jgi:hypothetical protein